MHEERAGVRDRVLFSCCTPDECSIEYVIRVGVAANHRREHYICVAIRDPAGHKGERQDCMREGWLLYICISIYIKSKTNFL